MCDINTSALGKKAAYIDQHTPSLLFPIPRNVKRAELGLNENNLPFKGIDIWNHYELSWLNNKGKPQVAIGTIVFPHSSPNIIESKSMKLYFNSLNNTKFTDMQNAVDVVRNDLSSASGATVEVEFYSIAKSNNRLDIQFHGTCIDDLDIICDIYQPNPSQLCTESTQTQETLYSDLLKSNCLVTNQPDWASIFIEYSGNKINHESLLRYIISLRNHNEFHEQCVERIFTDILQWCRPTELTVYARYTRRGGLDINPYRSTKHSTTKNIRLLRQ